MLSYSWAAASPKWMLTGNGEIAKLTAPDLPGASTTVEVTVSDADGKSAKASIVVFTAPNQPPKLESVTATPKQVAPGGSIDLKAAATGADGGQLTYQWSAPSGWTLNKNGEKGTVTAPTKYGQTATIDVTVTDGFGGTSVGSVSVSTEPNRAPIVSAVNANPSVVGKGGTSTLKVTASDPNGDTLSYTWPLPKGWTKTSGSGASIQVQAPNKFGVSGLAEVLVDDGNGAKTKGTVSIQTKDNDAPVILSSSATKTTLKPGETSTLSVKATDLNGDSLTYTWKLRKGWTGSSQTNSITVTAPRDYGKTVDVVLEVGDGVDVTAKRFTLKTVANKAPVVNSLAATPNPVEAGKDVTANVKASDPLGDPLKYN